MTLKEELDSIWNSKPCQVPLEICQWEWFGYCVQTLSHQLWKKENEEDQVCVQ